MAIRNPHVPYIKAVVKAMTDVPPPKKCWVSDAETGEDGETRTLSAVLTWEDDAGLDEYPDGLLVCWDLDRLWQYAAVKPDGSNEWPEDLGDLPLWATPEDVAAAVRALIHGGPMPASTTEWHDAQVMAAVKEWIAS